MTELPAGRELDALVAEKVMGWTKRVSADHTNSPIKALRDFGVIYAWSDQAGKERGLGVPPFGTDIAAAWLVVGELRARGLHLQMNDTLSAWRARFFTVTSTVNWDRESADGAFYQFADTAPLAIVRAALKATH